jgi:hypothetical protein
MLVQDVTTMLLGHWICKQLVAQLVPCSTVTVNVQKFEFWLQSVAVQVTVVVVPTAKMLPEGGVQATAELTPQQMLEAVGV